MKSTGVTRTLHKHLHLDITDDAGMPGDPEFRSALVAYLEWGTRLALGNSQEGAEVIQHAPVPRCPGAPVALGRGSSLPDLAG